MTNAPRPRATSPRPPISHTTMVPGCVREAAHRILNRTQPEVEPGDAELVAGFLLEME